MKSLPQIFEILKTKLVVYQPPFTAKIDLPNRYELWSIKDLVIDGRKRNDVLFAALVVQKTYVGFYFMPVYVEAELKTVFDPELLRLLKGKSCFYIKKLTPNLSTQVEIALKAGYDLYASRGWA